jgi:hypothetical protein
MYGRVDSAEIPAPLVVRRQLPIFQLRSELSVFQRARPWSGRRRQVGGTARRRPFNRSTERLNFWCCRCSDPF